MCMDKKAAILKAIENINVPYVEENVEEAPIVEKAEVDAFFAPPSGCCSRGRRLS